MQYSLLAHLYPRIKGSQEDVATFSLGYLLAQSEVLNGRFTSIIYKSLALRSPGKLLFRCQDSNEQYGRPDIAAYHQGNLRVLCEAKFYAGLTDNQPVSYLKRLSAYSETGLVFICPRNRILSLWEKVKSAADGAGFDLRHIADYCISCDNVRMSVISWNDIITELLRTAEQQAPEFVGDIKQLQGFCEKIESNAFIPFRPEEFSAQTARDIDRYYEVVDEVHKLLLAKKELEPSTKGYKKSPRWQGYSQYIRLKGFGVSIDYMRALWQSPKSIETPFWCHVKEVGKESGEWFYSDRIKRYLSSLDETMIEEHAGDIYISLVPKAYATLEELSEDIADQIIKIITDIEAQNNQLGRVEDHDEQDSGIL